MGILRWDEIDGESGTFSQGNLIKATRRFAAQMASPLDGLKEILTDPRVPKPYTPHPNINGLWVLDVDPQQDDTVPHLWEVDVDYSSEIEEREENKNPLKRPAKISWTSSDFSRIVTTNNKGRPILNAANDLIEDITLEDSNWVIRVEKNISKMPRWVLSYKNAVNADAVRIENLTFKPDSLKIRRLERGDQQEENDFIFYVLSFELHHNPRGWTTQILNRGFNELEEYTYTEDDFSTTKTRKKRILIRGEYPTTPQFLDKRGRLIRDADGEPKQPLDTSDFVIIKEKLEPRLPFRVLPLR